jgi:hypothetical protein
MAQARLRRDAGPRSRTRTREELPWLAALLTVALVMSYAALVSKIVIDRPMLYIDNPWGRRTLRTGDVTAVEPGPFGVQLLTSDGRRHVARRAVQTCCTRRPPALGRRSRLRHRAGAGDRTSRAVGAARWGEAKLSFDGEVFLLDLPGGYTWAEFGYTGEDAQEALRYQLALLDSYADPRTREVVVARSLRRPRTDLRLGNGAVLRRRGLASRTS